MNGPMDEAEIIGGTPTYYPQPRRRVNPAGLVIFACLCCICFFLVLSLVAGFLLTNGFNNNPTPSPTPAPTPAPPVPLQCNGFVDLANEQQPQVAGPGCVPFAIGTCSPNGVGFCVCTVIPNGTFSTNQVSTTFQTPVQSICASGDPAQQCQCVDAGISQTCLRILDGDNLNFDCTEELGCPFFTNVALADQPIGVGFDCALGSAAAGVCRSAQSTVCDITVFTANSTTTTVPPLRNCSAVDICAAAGEPCECFAPICTRFIDDSPIQFLCTPVTQIPPVASGVQKAGIKRRG